MSDLEGEDMLILAKFGKRDATASLAGRRARETRPLAAADRRRLAHGSTKSRQLNLKVRPGIPRACQCTRPQRGHRHGRTDRACCGGVRAKQGGLRCEPCSDAWPFCLGAVSISLAARYGYKGADTAIDGLISAVVFGSIALCAFMFDAAAVRLWFMRHRLGAVVIGSIAAAALVVTFTNSLGAIAGRADATQAERAHATNEVATDRAELRRLTREREAITLRPATAEAVTAGREAVAAAERIRLAECGNGDPRQRGSNCRSRETEEQTRRDALAALLRDQAASARAVELDAAMAAIRARLANAPAVQNANPLGATLEALLGAGASVLTAWQQAIVAAVFELCLVGVMVIYELLGHAKQPHSNG